MSTKWPATAAAAAMAGAGGGGGAPPPRRAPKVRVRGCGRGAALARLEAVLIHGQAHRAAGLAPLHAGVLEDPVQPFPLGLLLHQTRARYDHGPDTRRHAAAFEHARGHAQVLDTRIGAGA